MGRDQARAKLFSDRLSNSSPAVRRVSEGRITLTWTRRLHGHVRPSLPVVCRSRCVGSSSAHGMIARLRKGDSQLRELKIIEHISLDGVIQHSADDGDFPYSDWTAPYRTPAGRDAMLAAYGEGFDLLLGRRTYDIWSGFWPKAPSSPMADRLNAATKFIATHRPESLAWGPFEGVGPDIVEGIIDRSSKGAPSHGKTAYSHHRRSGRGARCVLARLGVGRL